jgi:CMP/dCMP kinase
MARSIEQLVNQQVLRWIEQQRKEERGGAKPTREEQRPMITVSREYGARGAELGQLVAARLGFGYFAQEIVHEIAKEARVRAQVVESVDERLQDRISEWVGELIDGGAFATSDYLRNLSKVVMSLGRVGRGVLIGRGAHLILDPARTLRVRTYAPLDVRIPRCMQQDHLDEAEARARVLRIDAERMAFYRQHFDVDVADPHLYDLLLNTGTLGMEDCADLVVEAYRTRFP